MYSINSTSFQKDLFNLLEKTVKYNEVLNISTKEGNAVVISEEEYKSLLATVELMSEPGLHKKIRTGMDGPLEACVSEA